MEARNPELRRSTEIWVFCVKKPESAIFGVSEDGCHELWKRLQQVGEKKLFTSGHVS